jgi:carbon-monoxide dehydrogenase large subunit
MVAAAEPGAPLVHPDWGTNVAVGFTHAIGDVDAAFAAADSVFTETFRIQRYVGMPMEGRGVVAQWDRRDETLTTWNSTQVSHFVQQGLTAALELPPHKIRVIAPDLGGGFGTKASGYAEDVLVPLAARTLGRPVKWIETRQEHMASAAHARHQTHRISLAARRRRHDPRRARSHLARPRAPTTSGASCCPYNTVAHLLGPHRVRDMRVDVQGRVTHKTPNAPYRGAGRPEAVFAMDRAVDGPRAPARARPAEIRRRNYLERGDLPWDLGMPYRDGNPLVYDSGDFRARSTPRSRRPATRRSARSRPRCASAGIWRGIGISGYVEGTAIGPFEGARVTLDLAGRVLVATGAVNSGQGHETSFAQVAADALGVPLDWVTVVGGDTAAVPFGVGTFASRSAVTAGSSIVDAARAVRAKVVTAAARLLEAAESDIDVEDGRVLVRGTPASAVPLARVVQASIPTFAKPGVAAPDFDATAYHHVPTVTFASAVHVAQVEVDPDSGAVRLLGTWSPRLRHGDQPDDRGGPGARRRRAGRGRRALRGDGLRRGRPAAERNTDGLRGAARRRPARGSTACTSSTARRATRSAPRASVRAAPSRRPARCANAIDDALAPLGVRLTATPALPARVHQLIERARRRSS